MEAPYLNIGQLRRENEHRPAGPRGASPQHEHDPRQFAALLVWWADAEHPSLLSCNDKVVVFDNVMTAKDFLPQLGGGRLVSWYPDGETAGFSPIEPNGINRVAVATNYDVYNLPPGVPVLSEAKHRDWRHHMMWSEMLRVMSGEQ